MAAVGDEPGGGFRRLWSGFESVFRNVVVEKTECERRRPGDRGVKPLLQLATVLFERAKAGDGEQRVWTARSTRSLRARGYRGAPAFTISVRQWLKTDRKCLTDEEFAA